MKIECSVSALYIYTHCGVSSVHWQAVRACIDEDGTYNIGRREQRGLGGGRGRGTSLVTEDRVRVSLVSPNIHMKLT